MKDTVIQMQLAILAVGGCSIALDALGHSTLALATGAVSLALTAVFVGMLNSKSKA